MRASRTAQFAIAMLSACVLYGQAPAKADGYRMVEAVVESVRRLSHPVVQVTLRDVRPAGSAGQRGARVVALSFPGQSSPGAARPWTEAGEAAWQLKPGERIRAFLWRQWGSEQWYLGRFERAGQGSDPERPAVKRLITTLKVTPERASPGESVRMTLTVRNASDTVYSYQTPTGQQYEFQVDGPAGRVWHWSHGKLFTTAIVQGSIRPGESKVYSVEWDLKDNSGKPAPPGEYRVSAWLTVMGDERPAAEPVTLVVKRS
ncbi:MAG: hypothetical protein KatS3mg024_2377 [Armatimonadota bacterium]|nr:MAG: hypothetical protein KatS3mg024_2377 [Armatimonadota bacterium]